MSTAQTLPALSHHVFFWLKNPGSKADTAELIAGIKTLEQIEGIRAIQIAVPASTESRDVIDSSYAVSELLFFDTVEAEQIYQNHPIHHAFIDKCSHLWSKVVVYDSVSV